MRCWWDAEDSNLVLPVKSRVHRRLCLHPEISKRAHWKGLHRHVGRFHAAACGSPGTRTPLSRLKGGSIAPMLATRGHRGGIRTRTRLLCRQSPTQSNLGEMAVPTGVEPVFPDRQSDVLGHWTMEPCGGAMRNRTAVACLPDGRPSIGRWPRRKSGCWSVVADGLDSVSRARTHNPLALGSGDYQT